MGPGITSGGFTMGGFSGAVGADMFLVEEMKVEGSCVAKKVDNSVR